MFIKKKKNKRSIPKDIPIIWVNIVEPYSNDSAVLL
jgi:hypothetical protein